MGFYQFFIIFICNTYLVLFNAFTATADDPAYSLTLTAPKSIQCPASFSKNINSTLQCAAGNPFEEFSIVCAVNSKLNDDHSIAWYQGSKNRSEKETLIESNERIQVDDSKLTIKSLDITDARVYHCRIVKKDDRKAGTPFIRQQSVELLVAPRVPNSRRDVTAIEENPITLNCTVTTSVPVTVKWHVENGVHNKTFDKSDNKYKLSGNESALLTDVMFTIKWANTTEDRGSYTCWAESEFGKTATNITFILRVRGKYAALWPFLGICTEVVILCVIILIYEKKRDKTELEESDTDQGPETKSSPDHVQDNVRYRK